MRSSSVPKARPERGPPAPGALFADRYELTMAQAYAAEDMSGLAVFEVFFRSLPPGRAYVVAAGLPAVLDFLERLEFDQGELEYLRGLGSLSEEFLGRLATVRFSGDVWAVPEGTIVFPNEPLLAIAAPILEAQLAETFVLNQVHLASVIASKTARMVEAAAGRPLIDFGSRRAHGVDAALIAARASYLAGAAGTSNLLAGRRYGLPTFGTMAHSFVQAFDDELSAFQAFARLYPGATLLVDTYDSLRGVDRAIELVRRLGDRAAPRAIRLDSGDLGALARAARARLDGAGLTRVGILASSGLDEHRISRLIADRSPIDAFGVGTSLVISLDAPTLDMAYKLVEYDGAGRTKLSRDKVIYPWQKQVYRRYEHGRFAGDTICRLHEKARGEPLLVPVMRGGERLAHVDLSLEAARRRAREQIAELPPALRALDHGAAGYAIDLSSALASELARLREALGV
jgi:nicotinate phosphoribosyltransferase